MYRLVSFGLLSLEHYNQIDNVGSGPTPTAYHALPDGGALDMFGSQQKHPGTVERTKSIRLRGATEEQTEQLYFQLLQLRGKRDRLYRRTTSGDIHWQYARLVEIGAQRSYEQTKFKLIQDIDLRFVTQESFWRGDLGGAWYLNDGKYLNTGLALNSSQLYNLDSSPTAITIEIGEDAGRAPTRAIRVTITAGSLAITSITIARAGGESLTFDAAIATGDVVIIDTGTMQVTNDGNDAYNDLALSPTADLAAWLAFEPGDNDLTITFTGGGTGSTIEFNYYEAWY